MERLTNTAWRNFDPWECCGQDNFCTRGCHEKGGCNNGCIVPKLYGRLAAYEDTGLEPEEINDMALEVATLKTIESMYDGLGNPDHLRDLLQAEQAGRLVVLPCKVGDVVFAVDCEHLDCNSCDMLEHGKDCPYIDKPICPKGTVRRRIFYYF